VIVKIFNTLRNENFHWTIGFYALITAAITHISFIILFINLGVQELAFLNVISVLIYLYCIFALGVEAVESKNDALIGWLVYFELIMHGVVATYFLGLECGFQYYIYTLVFLPFFTLNYTKHVRLVRVIFVIFISILLEIWGKQNEPFISLNEMIIYILHISNLFIFLFIMSIISYLYITNTEEHKNKLINQNNLDYLTNLFNRRYIVKASEKNFLAYEKEGITFGLLLIDIDYFKKINDTYGHICGDKVLVELSDLLKNMLRSPIVVSRWGGEEFLLLFSNINKEELKIIAERIRNGVENACMNCNNKKIQITITLGGAISENDESFDALLLRADTALYKGKENGRNQVCLK